MNKFYITLVLVVSQTYAFIKQGIPQTAYNPHIPKEIHIYIYHHILHCRLLCACLVLVQPHHKNRITYVCCFEI